MYITAAAIMCCIFSSSDLNRLPRIMPPGSYLLNGAERIEVSYTGETMVIDNGKTRVELEGEFRVNYRHGRVDVAVFDAHPLGDLATIITIQFRHGEISALRIESVLNSRGRRR